MKCISCTKVRASFNVANLPAKYCAKCKDDDMIDVKNPKCIKCKKTQPSFNVAGEIVALYCSKCKENDMIDVKHPKCITCQTTHPSFNVAGETVALYCSKCKEDDMIDVKHPKCITCQTTRPNFNVAGETVALYCSKCKEDDMIDVKSQKCIKCKKTHPSFNVAGETVALYCSKCKEDDMIDVKSPKCIKCKKTHPSFNVAGETAALYCSKCKEDDMIDVKHPKCITCQTTHPSFNVAGETAALYCSKCKEDDMIDVKNQKCIKCQATQPSFNVAGETVALYCSKCKEDDMIDVKNPKCGKCNTQAIFGITGIQPSHCAKHKLAGMISHPTAKCNTEKCKKIATHGLIKPIKCEEHAEPIHHNLINRECKQCHAIEVCNEEQICYEYCINTDIYMNRRKAWEGRIVTLLHHKIKKRFESVDAPLDTSCNSKRPDIVYNCGSFLVIVECDEKQHRAYGDQCETNRMIMIAKAAGLPVIFIRYNPDSFVDKNGKKSTISDSEREQHLVRTVKNAFNHPTTNLNDYIRVIYLFYDGYIIHSKLEFVTYDSIPLPAGFFDCKVEMENKKRKREESTDKHDSIKSLKQSD